MRPRPRHHIGIQQDVEALHNQRCHTHRLEPLVVDLQPRQTHRPADDEVIDTLREALALEPFVAQLRYRYFPLGIRDSALLWLLLRLTGRHGQYSVLTSGVENKTLELNRALERLSGMIRSSEVLRTRFAETNAAAFLAALVSGWRSRASYGTMGIGSPW